MHISSEYYLEIPAALTGLLSVYFAARMNIWNWVFGILTVSLYMIIFFQEKLYADMSLQWVYLVLQFYGWNQWRKNSQNNFLIVEKLPKSLYFISASLVLLLFLVFSFLLSRYTDSSTIEIDALTTALSLVAQWMMCKKWLENWWLWMVMDLISIQMYWGKQLYLTSGLYAIFFVVCCIGFNAWRARLHIKPKVHDVAVFD